MTAGPAAREHISGIVVPLDLANVDTDAIFPKQYGRSTARTGYGAVLFDNWRYLDPGDLGCDHARRRLNPDFVLNRPELQGGNILLARDNFGCGSSREHAVWALRDHGFEAILAPGFGDIFRNNCALNSLVAAVLPAAVIDALFAASGAGVLRARIDLVACTVQAADVRAQFRLAPRDHHLLLHGGDWIAATLAGRERIAAFEAERLARHPWLQATLES